MTPRDVLRKIISLARHSHACDGEYETVGGPAADAILEDLEASGFSIVKTEELERGNSWRDMSLAPRDGTRILVSRAVRAGGNIRSVAIASWRDDRWLLEGRSGGSCDFDHQVDGWIPLPHALRGEKP